MIDVTCAIIVHEDKVLATQRGPGMHLAGKWEFPGGKVEAGEKHESCIIREIKEELDIQIAVFHALQAAEYQDKIRLIPFVCGWEGGEICLLEHADFRWLLPSELRSLDWAEADIPVVNTYLSYVKKD